MAQSGLPEFEQLAQQIEEEGALRDKLRELRDALEAALRPVDTALGLLHVKADVAPLLQQAQSLLPTVCERLGALQSAVPEGCFYKYNDLWRQSVVRVVQQAVLLHFLETGGCQTLADADRSIDTADSAAPCGRLAARQDVQRRLRGSDVADNAEIPAVRIETDEYLLGVCSAIQEMSRLAANRVVLGDFVTPKNMAVFANEVHAGFRLLNFRNDALRRSYDGLKYAVQRLDGIQYDLSIRNLR
ncbi:hypothetical protein CDCA_CDCA05G1524 [Cyanidium caldarium]|uniref:Translin n=1 Tax=Cyanidium caldarium TaxID=2771 RepID=A0AAV9IT82_CYACA|nr:hypothetical protein CDCA_CDCA05G1524 [Cyanidium caldarium]